nr:hypothetical protein [uncultured Cohaesibacter sp.]
MEGERPEHCLARVVANGIAPIDLRCEKFIAKRVVLLLVSGGKKIEKADFCCIISANNFADTARGMPLGQANAFSRTSIGSPIP